MYNVFGSESKILSVSLDDDVELMHLFEREVLDIDVQKWPLFCIFFVKYLTRLSLPLSPSLPLAASLSKFVLGII